MAAGDRDARLHRAVLRLLPARLLAPGADPDLGRRAVADRALDVGRHSRPALRVAGALGRAAGDTGACDLRARLRLPARNPGGARPPLQAAGDPIALRALC